MDAAALASSFLDSPSGQQALAALGQQGLSTAEAAQALTHTVDTASAHLTQHASEGGLLGAHPGKSFFAAFAAGLVRGEGVLGALEDGAEGVVVGKVTETLGDTLGVDGARASTLAAAATPFVLDFLKQHLGGR